MDPLDPIFQSDLKFIKRTLDGSRWGIPILIIQEHIGRRNRFDWKSGYHSQTRFEEYLDMLEYELTKDGEYIATTDLKGRYLKVAIYKKV